MTSAATSRAAGGAGSFRAIQLLPAPVTVAALFIASLHHIATAPLGVIAIVGALATLCSVLLPAWTAAPQRSSLPAPQEDDRIG